MRIVNTEFGPAAESFLDGFYADVVAEVQRAVVQDTVVVVGMFLNPYVVLVRRALRAENIPYTYLQYGGYLSQWKPRLAIKMWSGWPTFPQVFVNGVLVGGCKRTQEAIRTGLMQQLLTKTQTEPNP